MIENFSSDITQSWNYLIRKWIDKKKHRDQTNFLELNYYKYQHEIQLLSLMGGNCAVSVYRNVKFYRGAATFRE